MMTKRLRYALVLVEELASEIQDQIAQEIEELVAPYPRPQMKSFAGLWRDLPDDDDEYAALDQIRDNLFRTYLTANREQDAEIEG
jgi:hypothetical protein